MRKRLIDIVGPAADAAHPYVGVLLDDLALEVGPGRTLDQFDRAHARVLAGFCWPTASPSAQVGYIQAVAELRAEVASWTA